jgi:hypothetical protein
MNPLRRGASRLAQRPVASCSRRRSPATRSRGRAEPERVADRGAGPLRELGNSTNCR